MKMKSGKKWFSTSNFFTLLLSHLDPSLKGFLRDGSIAFTFEILGRATGYIFYLLITRNIGVEALGIFSLSYTVLRVFAMIGGLGLGGALVRFTAQYSSKDRWDLVKEVYTKSLKMAVPFSIFLSVLLFFSSSFIANYFFNKDTLSIYLKIISIGVLPFVFISLNSESLRGLKVIREYSFLRSLSIFLFATVILLILLLFAKENHVPIYSFVISLVFISIISLILWLKKSKLYLTSHKNSIKARTILDVSLPMLLSGSLVIFLVWTDIIMLGVFRTEEEVGIYDIALKIAGLTNITLFAISSIAAPRFAELYGKGDIEEFGKAVKQTTRLIFWTSFPIFLVLNLFSSFILGIFGEDSKIGVYALILLLLGRFTSAISGPVGVILNMTGKQKIFQRIILITTIINITLNYVLIPRYGINGAAFASMISIILFNLGAVIYIKINFNILTLYVPILREKV